MKIKDIPEYPGLISVARAAVILGTSKWTVYYKIYDLEQFVHVYKLGGAGSEDRPVIMLTDHEVKALAAREKAAKAAVPPEKQLNLWNKRVKDWGRSEGWDGIKTSGRPKDDLVEAYLFANPDDPRPE